MKQSIKNGLSRVNRRQVWMAVWTVLLLTSLGCAGYQVGHQSLFRPDVRTVHVPIFQSESFRRGLGERLTEAVVKEIESRSGYKVTGAAQADSILKGRILLDRKHVLGENVNDEPRDLQAGLLVEVTWTNRVGQSLMQRQALRVNQAAAFVPEAGQSLATAHQEVIQRLAREIVQQMEAAW